MVTGDKEEEVSSRIDVTEEPKVFGEESPFMLVHSDDLKEVTGYLAAQGVEFKRTLMTASLYKLQFVGVEGVMVRKWMRELAGKGGKREVV